jgi:hypothetical protein
VPLGTLCYTLVSIRFGQKVRFHGAILRAFGGRSNGVGAGAFRSRAPVFDVARSGLDSPAKTK